MQQTIDTLVSFVETNKSAFSARQIHSFLKAINVISTNYSNEITQYQTKVNNSLEKLSKTTEFLEKFIKELNKILIR